MIARGNLIQMLMADPSVSDPYVLFPFPHLHFQQSQIQQAKEEPKPATAIASNRKAKAELAKFKTKLPLAGLIASNMWSQDDLKKWVEARRKRFPSAQNVQANRELKEEEMSTIEKKLRLKIMLLDEDYDRQKKISKAKYFLFKTATVTRRRRKAVDEQKPAVEAEEEPKTVIRENDDAPEEIPNPKNEEDLQEIRHAKPAQSEGKHKVLSVEDIIAHFKEKKKCDNSEINQFLQKQPQTFNYTYIQNTLFTNLVLDQVYEERAYLVDMIKFIVDSNFLQPKYDTEGSKE